MRGFGGFTGWSTIGGYVECSNPEEQESRLTEETSQTQSPYVKGGMDPTDSWLGMSVSIPIVSLID